MDCIAASQSRSRFASFVVTIAVYFARLRSTTALCLATARAVRSPSMSRCLVAAAPFVRSSPSFCFVIAFCHGSAESCPWWRSQHTLDYALTLRHILRTLGDHLLKALHVLLQVLVKIFRRYVHQHDSLIPPEHPSLGVHSAKEFAKHRNFIEGWGVPCNLQARQRPVATEVCTERSDRTSRVVV